MSRFTRPLSTTTTTSVEHWVVYLLPPENSHNIRNERVSRVSARTPREHAESAPAEAYGFYYYDTLVFSADYENQVVTARSEPCNMSATTYFIGGGAWSIDEFERYVKGLPPGVERIRSNGHTWVIYTRAGIFVAFDPERDEVIRLT